MDPFLIAMLISWGVLAYIGALRICEKWKEKRESDRGTESDQ